MKETLKKHGESLSHLRHVTLSLMNNAQLLKDLYSKVLRKLLKRWRNKDLMKCQ